MDWFGGESVERPHGAAAAMLGSEVRESQRAALYSAPNYADPSAATSYAALPVDSRCDVKGGRRASELRLLERRHGEGHPTPVAGPPFRGQLGFEAADSVDRGCGADDRGCSR